MKRTLIIALTAATIVFSMSARCENNWYFGAQYSAQEVTSQPDRELESVGVIGGYQFNEYVSIETRYNTGTSGYSHPFYVVGSPEAKYKEDIDTQISLLIRASYPVYNGFHLYSLAGITKSDYEITTSSSLTDLDGNTTQTYPYVLKFSDSGFTYGVGLNYQATEAVGLFVDYQVLPELKFGSGSSNDWRSINLGITFAF
ncbi:outer membrane beta-barrel protein [Alteromonas gilva]|uniref:Outer membrane beta-barrel protein n=1 Tax=Alteromonas gilva TaxID=2987522 RepID=A0ABT5L4A8_9ALTE|nr:outer membrane beta-barrel protein [Alteromonas gilva]MDC8831231.1 outer membrane beta-barrel protein [Alteromonas gilva]